MVTRTKSVSTRTAKSDGMTMYLKRVFALMCGAIGITALTSFLTMATPLWQALFTPTGLSGFYYV